MWATIPPIFKGHILICIIQTVGGTERYESLHEILSIIVNRLNKWYDYDRAKPF